MLSSCGITSNTKCTEIYFCCIPMEQCWKRKKDLIKFIQKVVEFLDYLKKAKYKLFYLHSISSVICFDSCLSSRKPPNMCKSILKVWTKCYISNRVSFSLQVINYINETLPLYITHCFVHQTQSKPCYWLHLPFHFHQDGLDL